MSNEERPAVHVTQQVNMTEGELRSLISDTVRETLTSIGVDHTDPMEMQRDLQYLRAWRKSSDSIRSKAILTSVAILVTGTFGLLWAAVAGKIGE